MSTFLDSFDRHTHGLEFLSTGVCSKCSTCQDNHGRTEQELAAMSIDDGSFSWSGCDTCGSTLGGNRYAGHAVANGELIHLDICTDCLLFIANGTEPEAE